MGHYARILEYKDVYVNVCHVREEQACKQTACPITLVDYKVHWRQQGGTQLYMGQGRLLRGGDVEMSLLG